MSGNYREEDLTEADIRLHKAVIKNDFHGVEEALLDGADINKPDESNYTPREKAYQRGLDDMVEFLENQGVEHLDLARIYTGKSEVGHEALYHQTKDLMIKSLSDAFQAETSGVGNKVIHDATDYAAMLLYSDSKELRKELRIDEKTWAENLESAKVAFLKSGPKGVTDRAKAILEKEFGVHFE